MDRTRSDSSNRSVTVMNQLGRIRHSLARTGAAAIVAVGTSHVPLVGLVIVAIATALITYLSLVAALSSNRSRRAAAYDVLSLLLTSSRQAVSRPERRPAADRRGGSVPRGSRGSRRTRLQVTRR
jgi:uncharacterized membrane protein